MIRTVLQALITVLVASSALADCAASSRTAHASKTIFLFDIPRGRDRTPDEQRRVWVSAVRDHIQMLSDCGVHPNDGTRLANTREDTERALLLSQAIARHQLGSVLGFLAGVSDSDADFVDYINELMELENRNQARRTLWREYDRYYRASQILIIRPRS